jgi:hypothetical protein
MKNYLVFYTNLMPKRFAGYTVAFIILLRPSVKGNIPLLEHEKVHVNQFWRTLGINGLFYLFSKEKRLQYELEAFRKQLEFEYNKFVSKQVFAKYLSTNYNLNITYEDALKLFD